MTTFSHLPLQAAIFQALGADSTLMSMITGVFDRPPQGTAYPYVTIGDAVIKDWSSKTTAGCEQLVGLHVWSREGGRKEAATIMERIHTLLHQEDLTVAGQTLVLIRFISSALAMEDDGWTYKGTMQFRALLQA